MAVAETVPVAQKAPALRWRECEEEHRARLSAWQMKLAWKFRRRLLDTNHLGTYRNQLASIDAEKVKIGLSYQYIQQPERDRSEILRSMGCKMVGREFVPMSFMEWLRQTRLEVMGEKDKQAKTHVKHVKAALAKDFGEHTLISTSRRSNHTKQAAEWTPAKSRLIVAPRVTAKQFKRGDSRIAVEFFDGDELLMEGVFNFCPFNCRSGEVSVIGGDQKIAYLYTDPPDKILAKHLVQNGPLPDTLNSCRVNVKMLSDTTTIGEKAVSKDATRPLLGKVLFRSGDDCLTIAATDTYRLLKVTVPAPGAVAGSDLSVSPFALKVALKGLKGEITVAWDGSRLYFSDDNETAVSVPYTQEKFVNINHVWPDQNKPAVEAKLLASDLVEGLTLMGIVGKEDANRVILSIGYGQAKLSAGGIHSMGGEMSGSYIISNQADYCWSDAKIAFNFRYLMDFVDRVKKSGGKKTDPELTLKMWGQEKAMLWQGGGMEYLLMPMQIF